MNTPGAASSGAGEPAGQVVSDSVDGLALLDLRQALRQLNIAAGHRRSAPTGAVASPCLVVPVEMITPAGTTGSPRRHRERGRNSAPLGLNTAIRTGGLVIRDATTRALQRVPVQCFARRLFAENDVGSTGFT